MLIKEFLKEYWEEIKIKKWNYLFKNNKDDTNIYFILEWEILLTLNWIDIAIVWEDEIIWEKSFLNKTVKPMDGYATKDTSVLAITQDIFKKFDNTQKFELLKQLTLFVSNRVYFLNEVINNIAKIWEKISNNKINLSTLSIWEIFSNLIKVKKIYIYKKITWWIIPLYESNINIDFIEKNKESINNNKVTEIDDKYTIINTLNYIFILDGEKLKNDYIINNVFMHTINKIEYLWLLIEKEKNKVLEGFLEE